ncbi:photosystem I subunit O [Lotus japonicus]|uniref:Photosystem I subunit O n=1 Tax=Lotus japonicus TaxID=34305 RepID=I3SWC1_LOTJA|nr:photosystem I subunit O [Lotus japonicus]AFK44563.1 unknown [Lotus japonicus]
MATTFATVAGLGGASLSPASSRLTSDFVKSPVSARNPLRQAVAMGNGGRVKCFERNWLRTDFNVIGFGLIGWIAPSSIPAIDGKSLTGLFFDSIGTELAHFPSPPALDSQFWLWLVTWHLGLFIVLTFGQIGFKGRTDEYF